jgi:GntR family transcriptional regulator, transcriptional repressor for pyruvate dehydrogenase complex
MTADGTPSGAPPVFGGRPIAKRKTYELVAERLVELIGDRSLRSGDQLPTERELTETFGVGRSSIREALRMLESQGVIRPGSGGAFAVAEASNPLESSLQLVFALDDRTSIHDLFELRRIIDCEAAALAALRRTDEHLGRMRASIDGMAAALAGGARDERFVQADIAFHLAVADATGNRLIVYSMQAAREIIQQTLLSLVQVPRSAEYAVLEHRAVHEAIESRTPDWARHAMREHLERVEHDAEKGVPNG